MRLSQLNFPVFGDPLFRGVCPKESTEQVTFFNTLRRAYPRTWGAIAVHVQNEGLKTGGHIGAVAKYRSQGMVKGAADIFIPGNPSFVCELKRQDHTKSRWQTGQIEYLDACVDAGSFVCVALGHAGAWEAFNAWREETQRTPH